MKACRTVLPFITEQSVYLCLLYLFHMCSQHNPQLSAAQVDPFRKLASDHPTKADADAYLLNSEIAGAHGAHLLFAGLLTFVGRAAHAYTVALDNTPFIGRAIGTVMTVSAMCFSSINLLCSAIYALLQ